MAGYTGSGGRSICADKNLNLRPGVLAPLGHTYPSRHKPCNPITPPLTLYLIDLIKISAILMHGQNGQFNL
jgi:hypothetical protein